MSALAVVGCVGTKPYCVGTWTSFPLEACFPVVTLPFTVLLASHGVLFLCIWCTICCCVTRPRHSCELRCARVREEVDVLRFVAEFFPLSLDGLFFSLEGHSHNPGWVLSVFSMTSPESTPISARFAAPGVLSRPFAARRCTLDFVGGHGVP